MKDVTKKKLGQLSKALEDTQGAFRFQVEQLAEEARAEILPYFMKHLLEFKAGNGSWIITRPNGKQEGCIGDAACWVEDDELSKNIRDLLMLEVARHDHLGFYVRDIKRGEY
jgi:hypothetical protein